MMYEPFTANFDDNHMTLDVPFMKVNKESRTVSGFASLDNIDLQGHIVPIDASRKAFSRWRGNMREMHDTKKAVGRAVQIEEREYSNDKDGKTYKGMYVKAYVSLGAEDTWQKVLDGTLTGFSIGGAIKEKRQMYDPDAGRLVTKIEDFDLMEVSLVDTPANPLANILSIQKSDDGDVIGASGIAADVVTENVLFCGTCDVALLTELEKSECPTCDDGMESVGWVENVEGKEEAIKKMLEPLRKRFAYDTPTETVDESVEEILDSVDAGVNSTTGGVEKNMSDTTEKTVAAEEVVEEVVDEVTEVEETDEVTEKAAEVDEVEAVEAAPSLDDLAKRLDDIEKSLSELKSFAVQDVPLDPSEPRLDVQQQQQAKGQAEATGLKKDADEAADAKDEALTKGISAVAKTLETVVEQLAKMDERIANVEADGAIKKSGEVTELKKRTEGVWNGSFFGVDSLDDE